MQGETVTPTGAALLGALGTTYGPVPAMEVCGTGYGAGTRVFANRPNILPATLGRRTRPDASHVVIETNVDDVTGEVLGHVVTRLLEAGAADAWITPAVMKKGRPAHVVHVLCADRQIESLGCVLLAETGSLGLRHYPVDRLALPRWRTTVDVHGHAVRVNQGPWHAKPEHDDVVAVARALNMPARQVAADALGVVPVATAEGGES